MRNAVALNDEELENVVGGFGFGDLVDLVDKVINVGTDVAKKAKDLYDEVTRKPKFPSNPIIMNGNKN